MEIATGVIFTCSSTFQGLGNTWPSLLSSASRLLTFALPAFWLSRQAGFKLEHLWYLSVATVSLQMLTSLGLLRGQFRTHLSNQEPESDFTAADPASGPARP